MARRYSKKIQEAAHTLVRMIESGKHAGVAWTWESIGATLRLTPRQAKDVIYYLREHHDEFVWTVGTHHSGFTHGPASRTMDALDGIINQYRHALTRERSSQRVWTVLAKVEPEPMMARFADRESRWWERKAEETLDHLNHLVDWIATGGAAA